MIAALLCLPLLVSAPQAARSGGRGAAPASARLLVLSQPTRGLDVGSIQYIHRQIVAKRDEGVAVLLNSSELDEVLALADRNAVVYRGRVVGVLDREEANRERLGLLMAGAVEEAAAVEATGEEEVTVT